MENVQFLTVPNVVRGITGLTSYLNERLTHFVHQRYFFCFVIAFHKEITGANTISKQTALC